MKKIKIIINRKRGFAAVYHNNAIVRIKLL